MKLVLGLGNIGPQYARTRHNFGFMVTEQLAELHEANWQNDDKFLAATAQFNLAGERIIVAQPHTMMNLSGEAAVRLANFYKIEPADTWLVFDDVDVPFGRLRLRRGGASGQQGVRSVTQHLGSGFMQARLGISLNDRTKEPSEVYVLKPFTEAEHQHLPAAIAQAARILTEQLAQAEPTETTFDLI
ncbi:MAG TPA: aminoacyl-tRNA hydrolase [Candidatus Saccharimonadia bacterium]|nr:aminoacyl-tRNA hydrolase [Candidatus Saccharimonadia bacterium]